MRCARRDQTTSTVTLHYLTNGDARLRFAIRKQEFLVPVVIMLRALCAVTDRELYERALAGDDENTFFSARLEVAPRCMSISLPSSANSALSRLWPCDRLTALTGSCEVLLGTPRQWGLHTHRKLSRSSPWMTENRKNSTRFYRPAERSLLDLSCTSRQNRSLSCVQYYRRLPGVPGLALSWHLATACHGA